MNHLAHTVLATLSRSFVMDADRETTISHTPSSTITPILPSLSAPPTANASSYACAQPLAEPQALQARHAVLGMMLALLTGAETQKRTEDLLLRVIGTRECTNVAACLWL